MEWLIGNRYIGAVKLVSCNKNGIACNMLLTMFSVEAKYGGGGASPTIGGQPDEGSRSHQGI
jgi:hypothetical protein